MAAKASSNKKCLNNMQGLRNVIARIAMIKRLGPYIMPLDYMVLFVILFALILFFVIMMFSGADADTVEIKTVEGIFLYVLHKPHDLMFKGPLGETAVRIDKNTVRVVSSPGRQKICIKAGPISRYGQWLACLPNRIFIRIVGNDSHALNNGVQGTDAVSF